MTNITSFYNNCCWRALRQGSPCCTTLSVRTELQISLRCVWVHSAMSVPECWQIKLQQVRPAWGPWTPREKCHKMKNAQCSTENVKIIWFRHKSYCFPSSNTDIALFKCNISIYGTYCSYCMAFFFYLVDGWCRMFLLKIIKFIFTYLNCGSVLTFLPPSSKLMELAAILKHLSSPEMGFSQGDTKLSASLHFLVLK